MLNTAIIILAAFSQAPADQDAVNFSVWVIEATGKAQVDAEPQRTPVGGSGAAATKQEQWPVPITQPPEKTPVIRHDRIHFDEGTKPIRQVLLNLPYTRYKTLDTKRIATGVGEEGTLQLNERYRLYVTPLLREPDERVRLDVRVEAVPINGDMPKAVKVVEGRMLMAPGKPIKLSGFKLGRSEMVVVLVTGG